MLTAYFHPNHNGQHSHASNPLPGRCVAMAQRPKTPSTPAKRGKNTTGRDAAAAPAKTRPRRNSSAAEPPAESAVQEQTFESPPGLAEHQPAAAEAGTGREERANRALEAIKTLSEMIMEGIGTLAELRTEMRQMNGRLDQLAANGPNAGRTGPGGLDRPAAADSADDYPVGRDRDPGDAVPPGVAVMSPAPLTETDEAALHSLEELPKRTGRGKRGPRAKS